MAPKQPNKAENDGLEPLPEVHPLNPFGYFIRAGAARRNAMGLEAKLAELKERQAKNTTGSRKLERGITTSRREAISALLAGGGVAAAELSTGVGTAWFLKNLLSGAPDKPSQPAPQPKTYNPEKPKSKYRKHLDKRFGMIREFLESTEILLPKVDTTLTDITNNPDEIDRVLTANFTPMEQTFTSRIEKIPQIKEKLFEKLPPFEIWEDQSMQWSTLEHDILEYIGKYDNDLFDVFPGGRIRSQQDREIKLQFLKITLTRFMNREAMKKGYCLAQGERAGELCLRKIKKISKVTITDQNITWDVPMITVTNENRLFEGENANAGAFFSVSSNYVTSNNSSSAEEFAQFGVTNKEQAPWIYERGQAVLKERDQKQIDTVDNAIAAHEAFHWMQSIDYLDLEIANSILNEVFGIKDVLSEQEQAQITMEDSELMDVKIKPIMLEELGGEGMHIYHAANSGHKEAALTALITMLVKYFKVENFTIVYVLLASLFFEGGLKKGQATDALAWSQGQKLIKEITIEELKLLGALMVALSISGMRRVRTIYNQRHPRYTP